MSRFKLGSVYTCNRSILEYCGVYILECVNGVKQSKELCINPVEPLCFSHRSCCIRGLDLFDGFVMTFAFLINT